MTPSKAAMDAAELFYNATQYPDRTYVEHIATAFDAFAAERSAELIGAAEPWECFQDPSYYDMWCVRQAHDRTFGQGFHLLRGEEAGALRDMLNAETAREAALLEALRKYGRHHRDCDKRYGENDGMDYSAAACTCGFTALAEQQREEG